MYNMNEKISKAKSTGWAFPERSMVNRDSRITSLHTYCRKPP